MKKTSVAILVSLSLLSGGAFAQEQASNPKIAVVPFAALSGDVPQRAGDKAASMLTSELKSAEGFALVDVKKSAAPDPYAARLDEARKLVEEAQALRSKRKFNAAEETLQKALAAYKEGAPGLEEIGELQDAYVLLSAIQYLTGRDEEGEKTLQTALALAPARELPLAKTSPLFTRVVSDARAALEKAPKGTLLVESTPMGAQVTVDGVSLGTTPLQITDVPAGVHVWRVQLPSGEATGGVTQVVEKKQAKVTGQPQTTDPESKILATLSQNKIDQSVLDAAKQHAQTVQADMLIFGALSREGKKLALDSFVLKVESGELKRLPRSTFDTELLSAGMEFYNLVGKLAKEGLKVGSDTRLPGPVSAEFKSGGVKVAEVRFGQNPNKTNVIEAGGVVDTGNDSKKEEKDRKPLEKKRRVPLRK